MFCRRTIQVFETALLAACMIASLGGCGKSAATVQTETRNFKALGVLYGKYVGAHGGRKPASESDLVEYISTQEGDLLKHFGVEDPRKLLLSARDGQPLTVVYGGVMIADPNPIAAFESEPTNGKRWVVWTSGMVIELDEAEFQKLKLAI